MGAGSAAHARYAQIIEQSSIAFALQEGIFSRGRYLGIFGWVVSSKQAITLWWLARAIESSSSTGNDINHGQAR
jgi:hypothetical protein